VHYLRSTHSGSRFYWWPAVDKQGQWHRWYTNNIPVADDRFDDHLRKLANDAKQHKSAKARKGRKKTMTTLDEWLITHPIDRAAVEARKARMRGEVGHTQIDTLRRYVDALGGQLRIEVDLGDDRIQIA
jgi:hypothetical protein